MKGLHRVHLVIGIWSILALLLSSTFVSAETVTLKYATMNAPTSWHHTEFYVKWAEKVEKLTEGRVKIKIYPAQTLGKAPSFFDLVKTGVADIALGVTAYNPGQFPLTEMLSLPILPLPNASAASATLWELYEKYPEMQKEYEGTTLLHFGNTSPAMIINNKRPVHNLADLQGLQLRVAGSRAADAVTRLGAVPVSISISEMYVAIEKGVVDGVTTVWEAFSQIPVDKLKFITTVPLYTNQFWVAANTNSWNKISKQDQDIIMKECGGMAGSLLEANVFDSAEGPARELTTNWTYSALDEAELAKWKALTQPVHEEYIAELEKRGLPARAFYNDMMDILERYQQVAKYPLRRESN
ncbi:MAG: TRAP transporter substrate-binding protein [Desulfopila sp.]